MVARPQPLPETGAPIGLSFDVAQLRLPPALADVAETIVDSRALLRLEDDWDDEGAKAFDERTWRRAIAFLARTTLQLWERHGVTASLVEVLPAAHGALAIDLRTEHRELLVTVPADPVRDALFYGDNGHGERTIKGTLDTAEANRWLTEWLAE